MRTKIIEATQSRDGGFNWGKFLVGRMDTEWGRISAVGPSGRILLDACGWSRDFLWILDLQTGEGVFVRPGGSAHADLDKHQVWVCPMFEPFLAWLYQQDLTDLDALDDLVELPSVPGALAGYRRPGPAVSHGPYLVDPGIGEPG